MKRKMCKVFENNGLSITIEANSKVVNFLDINLDLNSGIFKPFMKENDTPTYVHSKSNHPPVVLKNIPLGVNRRLNTISANKDVFVAAAVPYQNALNKSGFSHKLEFQPAEECTTKKKNRKRNVTWFNPPYSANVKTNVGKEFLKLIDSAFPFNNPLCKLFTRQTVKVSYKCMPNMAQAVSRHNMKVLQGNQQQQLQQPGCNCRGGPGNCPVQGHCKTDCVVYRATVKETMSGSTETYTGVTGNTFKERWYGHRNDMKNEKKRLSSKLSSHIWDLKDERKDFEIKWSLIDRSTAFNPITKKCRICLKEKYQIMYNGEGSTLNKRQEIFNSCRHRTQKLLVNVKS